MKWVAVTMCMLALLTGCGTTPSKLIASTSTTAQHAMKAWAVYVVDGHATQEQETKAKQIQAAYYSAEDVALAANKSGDKEAITTALGTLFGVRSNLVNFVTVTTGKVVQ